ncbi:hypothetical protein E4656_01715 [Natronospirillum operosum]|uniref:Bacterial transcriptional activator domain-containing protein n=1 Tax=Natronospirillum operosum TaxID=2759953 RepID=A0A4Z0WBJ0_9GAMM|nr:hypothetical protein [Natronospirillum operosum]TGG95164.1 hypothetical protein E4656_01715 [Natronospirillum operosum]
MDGGAPGVPVSQGSQWLARPHLTDLIARNADSSILWLAAAGGYGKTSTARSYAAESGKQLLQLPVPPQGLSIGGFFYALRQQVLHLLGDDALALPVLNPEYTASPEVFVVQFAQTLLRKADPRSAVGPQSTGAERSGLDWILFIDDMHHIPAESPLHRVMATTVGELLSGGVQIVIASRREPPPTWISLRGKGQLTLIDEALLTLSPEEASELLLLQGLESDDIRSLVQGRDWSVTGLKGWPAGLMLLVEHCRRQAGPVNEALLQRSLDDWFMAEVYSPLSEREQLLLRFCACPRVIPEALLHELTGESCAADRLQQLHAQHAFLRQEQDAELGVYYVFHDLFRDFLNQQSRNTDDFEARQQMSRRWADALWAASQWSDSAELMIASQSWEALADGLRQVAGILLQTGRGDQLFGWLMALPEELRHQDAHLSMWFGMCLILNDTATARQILAAAWQALSEQQDYLHMAVCWSGIVDSIWLEWAHISQYDPWIDEFLAHEQAFRQYLPPQLWYPVLRGVLTAYGYARPLDPELERWELETLNALAGADVPDTERVMMASQLMYLNTWQFGRRAGAAHVMQLMRDQQQAVERASPLARSLWYTFTSLWALMFEADRDRCMEEAEKGRELIRSHGICTWDNAVPPLHCALCFEDRDAYDNWMRWFMRTEIKAHRPFYDTFQSHFLAGQAWLHGRTAEAIDHSHRAIIAMDNHGSASISAGLRATLAGLLAESGQLPEALRQAREARVIHRQTRGAFIDSMVYPALARIPLARKQPARALPYLRRWLPSAAREQMFFPIMIRARELSEMCALALRHDIESAYVRLLIRARDLIPPSQDTLRHAWPWRCRIHVLGRFDIELDGQPGFRLAQKRARAVLSELIMAGPDGLPQARLATTLWPDSTEQRALNSLHVTIHRLRDQLGEARILLLDGGQVRLNPDLIWIDTWAFMNLARRPERQPIDTLQMAYSMYQGIPQLSGLEAIDLEIYQESVSRAFEQVATELGRRLEASEPDTALSIYRGALKHRVLVDTLWEGILRLEAQQGRWQGLTRAWQQLSSLYQQELDGPPPRRMQQLYEALSAER